MFRLTLKTTAFGDFNEETKLFEKHNATQSFDCSTLQQLSGLLEFMVATCSDVLELTISRMEETDD